ncbi:hypothetical protein Tco_0791947 [Tanacetum coccineum]
MLKSLLSNKEKLLEVANTPLNENFSAVILKKLPEKLGNPGKFLIPCGFSELKCKDLADLGASINLMPLLMWKKLADFIIVDCESDPRVPLILGRPFLRTARALIDVHGEEMILRDGDKRLILNMRHDTSSYSNQPHKESINMIDIYNVSHEEILEDLFATNHLSGNPTSSFTFHTDLTSPEVIQTHRRSADPTPNFGNHPPDVVFFFPPFTSLRECDLIWKEFEAYLASNPFPWGNDDLVDYSLEEFADELAHFTFPPEIDYLPFDAESDLREIEYLLNHDPIEEMDSILMDFILEDSVDSFDDNLKIKESKLLIYELDLPGSSDFLPSPECDSVFYEDFSNFDVLSSTNNEDKVFNPGILIHGNLFEVTIRVTPEKNVKKTTNASLILEDFNPPLYGLPFHKEVPGSETLLSFSSENEEKVFNPRILTSKGVHTSLLPELSHRGPKAFKVIKIFESPMEIFPCSYGEDIRVLDVPCLHFYPP